MKKLLCSILMVLFIVGCVGLFPVGKATINIKNCDPDIWVGVAYFTEYDKYGNPTDYMVFDQELKDVGEMTVEHKPGRYIITYFKPNIFGGTIMHYEDFTIKAGEVKNFSYGCE